MDFSGLGTIVRAVGTILDVVEASVEPAGLQPHQAAELAADVRQLDAYSARIAALLARLQQPPAPGR